MRIDVSVPGIRKERGKLPAPTILGALTLLPPAAGPPICGELGGPPLCEPVTGPEVGPPVATAHPVSANTTQSTAICRHQRATNCSQSPSSAVRPQRVAPPRRLRSVELAIALFDAASPLVPRNDDPDMVRASRLACRRDFLLRLAGCQRQNPIAEVRGAALAASRFCGPGARAPAWSRWSRRLGGRGRRFGRGRLPTHRARRPSSAVSRTCPPI